MKKVYLSISVFIIAFISTACFFTGTAWGDSNGKAKATGSPDETTCSASGCHGAGNGNGVTGLADNAGPGSITLTCSNMPGWMYTPGTTYHMTVTITDPAATIFGFGAIGLDAGLNAAGSMVVTDNTHTHTGSSWPIAKQYITHTGLTSPAPGTATTTSPAVFNFDWTPASNVGTITFYYDGIAGNNNQQEDGGDNVYSGTKVLTPVSPLATPTILSDMQAFTLRAASGSPGTPLAFYVAGAALTGNVSLSIPSPMELSTSFSGPYSGSINLSQSGGMVNSTKVWVRYNPTLSGTATQTLTISSSGATSKTATMTGQLGTPTINTPSPTVIPGFTTTVGTPSVIDSFTVTSSGLIDTFKVTAPTHFEISTHSNRGFKSTEVAAPFPPFWGYTNLKVYVRYNPLTAGVHSGNVVISSTGGTSKTVAVSGVSTAPTGIGSKTLSEADLNLYPNPAKETTRLKFHLAANKQMEVRIIDYTGKQYFTTGTKLYLKGDHDILLSTESLPAGLYFVSVSDGSNNIHKSFVKQ